MRVPSEAEVSQILAIVSNNPRKLIPLFIDDYNKVRVVTGIKPERVIQDQYGKNKIFMVNKEEVLKGLKNRYSFFTKNEAAKELALAAEEL